MWLVLLAGCGGTVEGGSSDSGPERDEGKTPEPAPDGSASPNPNADTELGSCTLGRKEDWREPCPWVADGRCYDDRTIACNCACPRTHDSQCTSGFDDGPDGHVWVTCN